MRRTPTMLAPWIGTATDSAPLVSDGVRVAVGPDRLSGVVADSDGLDSDFGSSLVRSPIVLAGRLGDMDVGCPPADVVSPVLVGVGLFGEVD